MTGYHFIIKPRNEDYKSQPPERLDSCTVDFSVILLTVYISKESHETKCGLPLDKHRYAKTVIMGVLNVPTENEIQKYTTG